MKKAICLAVLCVTLLLNACSFQANRPKTGIWYCEELNISIDFSVMSENADCAKLYSNDGTHTSLCCYIDYGTGISICTSDQETYYLVGNFKYKNDVFEVTTLDGNVYSFVLWGTK